MARLCEVDIPARTRPTRTVDGERLRPAAGRELRSTALAGAGRVRLESEFSSNELHPVRHNVAKRRDQYPASLDDQAGQRSLHCVESRLATVDHRSPDQTNPAERHHRGEVKVDVPVLMEVMRLFFLVN